MGRNVYIFRAYILINFATNLRKRRLREFHLYAYYLLIAFT